MDRRGTPRIDCALDATMTLIGGKWKAAILCKLHMKGELRFNQLMRELEIVSPKILTKQLREMENDGLINRTVYPAVPACVEYSITPFGRSLSPALGLLAQWGVKNMFHNLVRFDEGTIFPERPAARP
jgi:DNA-binding HxlR family transcriptional regulator